MIKLKHILCCLVIYFLSLYLFFKSQFVSYDQIEGVSTNFLTEDRNKTKKSFKQDEDNGKKNVKTQSMKQSIINAQNTSKREAPQVKQVIFIIIDAFRYDYAERMKFFKQTVQKYPRTTLIKKSVAGLPTMTTQRIESVMTGSQIFTSTNLLEMFLSSQSKTDNIIDQLIRNNKSVKVFGDDTWVKLFNFPKQNSSFVCDSTFNIRDYESCDNLIYDNLERYIKRKNQPQSKQELSPSIQQEQQFDQLLVAHFLAIDHIGHSTSSITSPQIQIKLDKMSVYFSYLLKVADEDSMFIITGDHGMREDGNHGGSAKAQTQTVLFAHYKSKQQETKQMNFNQRIKNFEQAFINQVDITPTLTLLLDIPNPINSIGYPIVQILPQKYVSYLQKIELNIMDGYKNIINHYKTEGQNHQNQKETCLQKINRVQKLIQTGKQNSFQEAIKRKQYIKTQVQLSSCLSGSLSMVRPNNIFVISSLVLLGLSFIFLIGIVFLDDLKNILKNLQNRSSQSSGMLLRNGYSGSRQLFYKSTISLVLQQLAWICSLFVIYFSWNLIRNSSTYMLSFIVIMIIISPLNNIKVIKKTYIIFLLLLLTQFQSPKVNEYQLNYFNFEIVNQILEFFIQKAGHFTTLDHLSLKSLNQQHLALNLKQQNQLINIKRWMSFAFISFWFIFKFKTQFRALNYEKKKFRRKNFNKQDFQSSLHYWSLILKILILTFIYLHIALASDLKIISHQKRPELMNQGGKLKIFFRYLIVFSSLAKLILDYSKNAYHKKTQSLNNQLDNKPRSNISRENSERQFYVFGLSSIMFGFQDFFILFLFLQILGSIICLNQRNKIKKYPEQYQKIETFSLNFGLKIILIGLVCEYTWWILGNRYEYSSIDIKKSYLFTEQFTIAFNATFMIIWLIIPFLIAICLIDKKITQISQNQVYLLTKHNQSRQDSPEQQKLLVQAQGKTIQQSKGRNLQINLSMIIYRQKQFYLVNMVKFLYIPLSGLLSGSLNLYYNNQKILFTVVYVPLMMLGMIKAIFITVLIVGFILIQTKRLPNKNNLIN